MLPLQDGSAGGTHGSTLVGSGFECANCFGEFHHGFVLHGADRMSDCGHRLQKFRTAVAAPAFLSRGKFLRRADKLIFICAGAGNCSEK
jgi:hypothetical protein